MVFKYFWPTCSLLAKQQIEQINLKDGFFQVKIKGCDKLLFYHQDLPLTSLYQTLAEQLYSWQWHFYQIQQTRVNLSDIIFDCGAAEGVFAFLNLGKAKHIYLFEPLPEYVAGLKKTFMSETGVTVLNLALGEKIGEAFLKKAGINSSLTNEETPFKVVVDTIDNFCQRNNIVPTYLKADLEGYEMKLLEGAKQTIKKYKPKIAITTYHQKSHAQEIKALLLKLNPAYHVLVKGIEERHGAPVMLHAW